MKVAEIRGVDVCVDGTRGQAMLMLHGWPDTSSLWDAQVEALQEQYRCVRITLPGFAPGSPRRATSLEEMLTLIDEVIDEVSSEEPIVLLLHDWGCFFGYQYAMLRPDRIARAIGVDIGDAGSPAHVASLTVAAKAMTASYQLWLAAAWRIGGPAGNAMTRAMARRAKAPAPSASVHAGMNYPYDILWTGSHGSYKDAPIVELACPLLFVYGRRKPFMFHSPAWAEALALQPGCQVVAVEAGHWVMRDEPDILNSSILQWMKQLPRS